MFGGRTVNEKEGEGFRKIINLLKILYSLW
jgi:hypothetical protein